MKTPESPMQTTQTQIQPTLIRNLALLTLGIVSLLLASPALAATGGDSDANWAAFLGRMHVLVLHLPIGLIIGAFALEFFGLFRRSKGFDIAAAWLLVLGALSAIVAVFTGLLLGAKTAGGDLTAWSVLWADDELVGETLNLHMWLGVGVMLFAIPAAVLKVLAVRKQWVEDSAVPERGGWPLIVARLGLVSTMLLLPSVGHLGGNMTHGQDYLTKHAPLESIKTAINLMNLGTTEEVVDTQNGGDSDQPDGTVAAWVNIIQPALKESCFKCHGTDQKKGGIRLHTFKHAIEAEGLDYPVITAGDAQFSALYTVITLPKSHDMYMPPDPKDALTQEMVEFIGEWLQNYDGRLEDPEPVKPETGDPTAQDEPKGPPPIIDPAALNAITSAGGNAQSLSQEENSDELTVKFAYLKDLDPAIVAKLESGADKIAWLNFEGSSFNDDAAKALPGMAKLTKLNLKDSAITDAGLAELPDMPSLIWLNLFGTGVTDAGLESLKQYDTLDKLYLTGTKVTAEGVNALREAMKETQIFSDHDGQFQFNPVTPDVSPGDPAKDDKAASAPATKPVNAKCPVSGAPVKDGFVSTFEGKTVGFCCNNCKGQFDKDPKKFAAKIQ